MTRYTGTSVCLLDKKGVPLPPCQKHPGRPLVFVRYDLLGFSVEAWADDEAQADKLAKEALRAKLVKRAEELRGQAAQLDEEAKFLDTV